MRTTLIQTHSIFTLPLSTERPIYLHCVAMGWGDMCDDANSCEPRIFPARSSSLHRLKAGNLNKLLGPWTFSAVSCGLVGASQWPNACNFRPPHNPGWKGNHLRRLTPVETLVGPNYFLDLRLAFPPALGRQFFSRLGISCSCSCL
jgi:hypothetical protein